MARLHMSWRGISSYRDEAQLTAEAKAKLQQFWKHKYYLMLDEYSMLAKDFFGLLSRNIGVGKEGSTHIHDPLEASMRSYVVTCISFILLLVHYVARYIIHQIRCKTR